MRFKNTFSNDNCRSQKTVEYNFQNAKKNIVIKELYYQTSFKNEDKIDTEIISWSSLKKMGRLCIQKKNDLHTALIFILAKDLTA